MQRLVVVGLLCAGACRAPDSQAYEWDSRRVLCSEPFDDATQAPDWDRVSAAMADAYADQRVLLVHAHKPGVTVSTGAIERMLALADVHGLPYFQFRELHPGTPRAGIAVAFDDNDVEGWLSIRDQLTAHHARVTFFVSRYEQLTDVERAGLDTLAADGHDLEPHSVNHLHAHDYVAAHGVAGYVTDEVMPSITALAAAGYPATTYAYPFGERSDALDTAILSLVDTVRTTPGECPP